MSQLSQGLMSASERQRASPKRLQNLPFADHNRKANAVEKDNVTVAVNSLSSTSMSLFANVGARSLIATLAIDRREFWADEKGESPSRRKRREDSPCQT